MDSFVLQHVQDACHIMEYTLYVGTVCLDYLGISDLRYISILQYIDTVNKYGDTILYLENRDT